MTPGQPVSPSSPRAIANRQRMDDLAAHIANGGTNATYARATGMHPTGVSKLWRKIVAGLGAQAI